MSKSATILLILCLLLPGCQSAADRTIIIRPVGNEMRFQQEEIRVRSGESVEIVFENIANDPAMLHNIVILRPGSDIETVGMAALAAGAGRQYLPDLPELLFGSDLAKPGETVRLRFTAPSPGEYPYTCTFPGHWALMKGVLIVDL